MSEPVDIGQRRLDAIAAEAEELDLTPRDGLRKVNLTIAGKTYRMVTFDDGVFRVWGVASVRPVGTNSVVIEPFMTAGARQMADEEAKAERDHQPK